MSDIFIGVDMGTSGARALALANDEVIGLASAPLSGDKRDPYVWRGAVHQALDALLATIDKSQIRAIAFDGTSGTLLAVDHQGQPKTQGLMYNDVTSEQAILARIAKHAPARSAVHGASSALARFLTLQDQGDRVLHQADWLAYEFSGVFFTDENNALKTGYDPEQGEWPNWMEQTGAVINKLPKVYQAGEIVGTISSSAAQVWGLPPDVIVVAGTTDGCASFLSTGASQLGDGVTALGTTLTLKFLSPKPIFAPEYGIYSHKLLGAWLAGGASNTGGEVLLGHFDRSEIEALSTKIDLTQPSALAYYPLLKAGERFPRNDPQLEPILQPVPESRAEYLRGFLEGIADIEAEGYALLSQLSEQKLNSVRTVGGGAKNPTWQKIREAKIDAPFLRTQSVDAAYGTAILAQRALKGAKP